MKLLQKGVSVGVHSVRGRHVQDSPNYPKAFFHYKGLQIRETHTQKSIVVCRHTKMNTHTHINFSAYCVGRVAQQVCTQPLLK